MSTKQIRVAMQVSQDRVDRVISDVTTPGRGVVLSTVLKDHDGNPLCNGPEVVARVISAERGAHWSDQPHGRAGYYVICTVEVPDNGNDYVSAI